jgi:hypothetical protein
MRTLLACLIGLASAAGTNALNLEKRDSPAVLAVPMIRDSYPQLSKRSKSVIVDLDKERVDVGSARRIESTCRLTLLSSTSPTSPM